MAGLKRIILIDTHLPGIVELKLEGHTNICGTNASGKTTLQRLIPVFYGEYPSRVVPATRDSFERWYLPRTSSFIIYEYTRADGQLCQAVLSSTGNGVNYRFIGKAFELEDYLVSQKKGKYTSLSSTEIARNMKRNNVLVTSQLNTKDFRAILQNDHSVLNHSSNARELLGYSRSFSLCARQTHIRHMEKLAKAVHSKEGKMETIKAMIAAILEEDGVQPPTSGLSRQRVDDWIRECHLIKQFERIRPEFARLEQADLALSDTESGLAELAACFETDISVLDARVENTKADLKDNEFAKKQCETEWHSQRDTLNQTLSGARADVEKYSSELETVEQEYEHWQQQNIDQLKDDVASLGQWQNELTTVSNRYNLLTEQHQDVESAYSRQLAEQGERLAATLEELAQNRQQTAEKYAEQQQRERDGLHDLKQQFAEQLQKLNDDTQQRLSSLKVSHAELNATVTNTGFNEFEQSQLDLMDAAVKEATINEDAARSEYRSAQQAHHKAVQHRSQVDKQLERLRLQYAEQEKVIAGVQQLLYPGEGSLLEFLHKNVDRWETTVGKIIRPELLERTDLAPGLVADSEHHENHIFGMRLATEALDTPEYAHSEQQLQQQLQSGQAQLTVIHEQQNEQESLLAQANEAVRHCELTLSKQDNAVRSAESTRKRTQQDRESLQSEYQQALSQRRTKIKAQLASNEQAQQKIQSQFQQERDKVKQQQGETQSEHSFHWQQLLSDINTRLTQIDSEIRQAKTMAASERQELEGWLSNELNQRGVDVDEIGQLKKRQKALKSKIQQTESQRHLVADFERWYQHTFITQKVSWQSALSDARKQLAEAERSLASKLALYREQRDQYQQQYEQLEAALHTASDQQEKVRNLNKTLGRLNLPKHQVSETLKQDELSISQRVSRVQELLQQRETLVADVKNYIERFDQLIAAQAGTGLSDTWERAREECATTNAQGIKSIDHRRMVAHLAQLLNVIVPQKLQGLKEQGRIFGADLTQYYFVLADIDKRIVSQSRRISQEVDGELFLDGVSDSAVKIRSRISELEFWPELKQFREHYEAWIDDGSAQLPAEEYGQSMRKVLDILGRAALGGGISKLLDIELHLREGNSDLVIRTDRQLNESSSHGMAYMILCKFLLAFTRLLRGDENTVVHWPIDELGTLHQSNVKKIFDACHNNNISVVGAFPNPESEVLSLFENRYLIDKVSRQLQVVQPKTNAISSRIAARRQQQEVSA
ncbi:ATP-binding protein [Salinimonas marina]|uniref:ATP-binding protein n=1 Tax=Salinimonas marina TaxID=2785918 RepID=A0A7S9DW07_9ALTE|nr:ATP-binding protein [Salinimonas marina]QPG04803.1 ATP-binding protein [Salinimonas marina]